MDPTWWLYQFMYKGIAVLPWLVGLLLGLGIVSWSPLGRALLRYLRSTKHDADVNEQTLAELAGLREQLGAVIERLDSTERFLSATRLPPIPAEARPVELLDPDRIPTPR